MLPNPNPNPNPDPNPNPNPNPPEKRKLPTPTASVGDLPPCTECGKRFSSWKALFGHMRCHPERQWRGINPPPRFRRQPLPPAMGPFTADEYDVAAGLLLLANGPPKARPKRTTPGVALSSTATNSNCPSPSSPSCSRTVATAAAAVAAGEDHHRCSVCDRGFSSGQALGGHMRCHSEGTAIVVAAAAAAADAAANASTSRRGRRAEAGQVLDLNLPPPTENINEAGGGGGGGGDGTCLDLRLGTSTSH